MGCRSLIILAVFYFVSIHTVCVAGTDDESRYPIHHSHWALKKHNIIYPNGRITPNISLGMGFSRPTAALPPGHRSKSLNFKSRQENSYVKRIWIYQDGGNAMKAIITFRRKHGGSPLFPEFKQLRGKLKPYAQEDIAETLLSQISAAEDHAYAFLKIIYEEKFIPDFMAQEILKVFGGIDFRLEGYVPYTGNIEEPQSVSRRQPSYF